MLRRCIVMGVEVRAFSAIARGSFVFMPRDVGPMRIGVNDLNVS